MAESPSSHSSSHGVAQAPDDQSTSTDPHMVPGLFGPEGSTPEPSDKPRLDLVSSEGTSSLETELLKNEEELAQPAEVTSPQHDIVEENDAFDMELPDCDWARLEGEFHIRVKKLNEEEGKKWEEFESLSSYFLNWAQMLQQYEIERSYKRLKSQMTFVQNEELELKKKRDQYVKIVEAFQSALALLEPS